MEKRKKYFIDRKFQTKMIASIFCLVIGSIIIVGGLSYGIVTFLEKKNIEQFQNALVTTGRSDIIIEERFLIINPLLFSYITIGLLLSIVLATISLIIYSHHLAGPIYHIIKHLEQMIEGNYDQTLRLRKRDEFKNLAETINKLQSRLKESEVAK